MAYKEKTCPKCGVKHNKRGEFCSRSCGNSRALTDEQKRKIGEKQREWLTSGDDRAEAHKHSFISKGNSAPPEPVAPPVRLPLRDNQFIADGDVWEEC